MNNIEYIENLVRDRKKALAAVQIKLFLRLSDASSRNLFQACDWYRRLGMFSAGFKLVAPREAAQRTVSTLYPEGRRVLWAARFLNLKGASEFAQTMLATLELNSVEDYWVAGGICLAGFEYERAVQYFSVMAEKLRRPGGGDWDSYQNRLRRLSLADARVGLRDFAQGIALAEELLANSTEPLLLGVLNQALGEYHARAENYVRAHQFLLKSSEYFPRHEGTVDSALLFKWLGYTYGKLGDVERASALLKRSLTLFTQLQTSPEAWLDVLRLQYDLGLLDPEATQRLIHYPGLSAGFRATLPQALPAEFGSEKAKLIIDLGADEYRIGRNRYYGLPHEVTLLAWIQITGRWGLSAVKAKALLWQDSVYSYSQLSARLDQLIRRVRFTYGIKIQVRGQSFYVDARVRSKIRVIARAPARPGFFTNRDVFTARELSEYYLVSKSQRAIWLKRWRALGWIVRDAAHPRSRYRVCDGLTNSP